MADADKPRVEPENEGEGSRSGDEQYRAGVAEHLQKSDITEEAEQARREVEANPEEFRKAEEEGKSRSAGDLEGDAAGI